MIITDSMRNSKLFSNMPDNEIENALLFFDAKTQNYEKNEIIKRAETPLHAFGLVLSGSITVYMDDFDGNCLVMSSAQQADTFGESLCFLQKNAPVYIQTNLQTEILWLHCEKLKQDCNCESACDLRNRFIALLAMRALDMNDRIQILSKYTIREKLVTYFSQCSNRCGDNTFILSLDRSSLASYIGTERSALSRELSKMQKENIIKIEKNKITLLHH